MLRFITRRSIPTCSDGSSRAFPANRSLNSLPKSCGAVWVLSRMPTRTVDGLGVPFAGGGLTTGLRDLGRLGLLMLNEGEIDGERLFPAEVVQKIRAGGDRDKFGDAFPTLAGGSYTSQWWVFHNDHGAFAARGVHGQTIYIDPTAEMVLVRFASFPKAQNGFIDSTSLPAYQAVAEYLLSKG